ncbi:protease [Corallococcus praedator]|uniref:Protease n=1 Tax=Corallococcus praedator TaxID=2316724 RepID=A0ABX9QMB0_9BACT|nr:MULTISPECIES: zinc-dependent metalloprotease [Corallococcus]RKH18251.1 protease [Corallococcus sp. CA047B]RKH32836.1 protease [Corallococcus sp. CA031C]RKI11944.1 protease [Corallococcus praedator]
MFKPAAVLVVSCGVLLSGCGTDLPSENEAIRSNLIEAGFPAEDIRVVDGAVYLGHDAQVSLEASQEMLQRDEGTAEHYRTTNLVGASVTRICINPTAAFNSYSRLSQGLDLAIQNYNSLGLRFTMTRGPSSACNANITATTMSGANGSSGYPSGGLPYGTISIGTGLQSYSVDVNEHVITHQLGHTLGLRHTDFFNTAGCGGSEGSAGVGGILIPGTPTVDPLSIMNSCFSSTATGEFSQYDILALNYLY